MSALTQFGFELVCAKCHAAGVVFDADCNRAASVVICAGCRAPRGTLAQLRRLAYSDPSELRGNSFK
jgi:hypothetical protein